MGKIVIAGGGIMGSSIAYHLAVAGAAADVTVIEPDPTYEFAATPRAVGGVRLQHALPENVQMSLHGDHVYSHFDTEVTGGAVTFDPGFHRIGYLFLVEGAEAEAALEANAAMQRSLGVEAHLFDHAALRDRWPAFSFAHVSAGAYTPADGQIDPNAALMGYRRAAEGRGVSYRRDKVVGLDVSGGLVRGARLASGETLPVDTFVNAANCWAAEVSAMVGMKLPVGPVRRQQFHFLSQDPVPVFPAMRHLAGIAIRPHQNRYLCGYTNPDQPEGFDWTLQHEAFDQELWPQLAEQCQAFEAIKPMGGWVGHYDMCWLDGNMILDRWRGTLENFIVCAGFSGHGLQHGPAVGRAVKELILDGGFRSIDLARFSWQRVVDDQPLPDDGPKA